VEKSGSNLRQGCQWELNISFNSLNTAQIADGLWVRIQRFASKFMLLMCKDSILAHNWIRAYHERFVVSVLFVTGVVLYRFNRQQCERS
jgi:hypothetical protein